MPSDKTPVVAQIWEQLEAEGKGRRIVYFDDVLSAINHCNEGDGRARSTRNPANFMKDLLRGANASSHWPENLSKMQITGKQITGEERIFEFVPFAPGQTEPFPNPFEPTGEEPEVTIQSLSLPLVTKSLGRKDESWLIQVAVWLKVLETHFATHSAIELVEISHLQTGVKLNRTEIDSLFLAVYRDGDSYRNALLTCEAKQQNDPILGTQIVQQVASAYGSISSLDLGIELVIPVAIKAVRDRGAIYVAEFEAWNLTEIAASEIERKDLTVACAGLYILQPPVPGVGYDRPRKSRKAFRS